jgi:hypothetical protein
MHRIFCGGYGPLGSDDDEEEEPEEEEEEDYYQFPLDDDDMIQNSYYYDSVTAEPDSNERYNAQTNLDEVIQLAIKHESNKASSVVHGIINEDHYPGLTVDGDDVSFPLNRLSTEVRGFHQSQNYSQSAPSIHDILIICDFV